MKPSISIGLLGLALAVSSCVDKIPEPVKVATPSFSKPAGIIAPGTTVAISCATPGAEIQYWTNLDATHQSGQSYDVGAACTLYAQATKSGLEASDVASASYSVGVYKLKIDYTKGSTTARRIYAAWVADDTGTFVQNLFACEHLYEIRNIVDRKTLPYWRTKADPDSDVDVVSGASVEDANFAIPELAYKGSSNRITVYFEIDRSFDGNDWWTDQPSIIYAADVDLDDVAATGTYYLAVQGWSRNAGPATPTSGDGGNANKFPANPNPAASALGVLVPELRYIKNASNGDGTAFEAEYGASSANDATNMTGSIKLTVTKVE